MINTFSVTSLLVSFTQDLKLARMIVFVWDVANEVTEETDGETINESRHEKTCLRGCDWVRQTDLLSYRD